MSTTEAVPAASVLPIDIWSIIFEESARGAELHLTERTGKVVSHQNLLLVAFPKSFLSVCSTSRKVLFKHLVLHIDVANIYRVRFILHATFLERIQHIHRTIAIPSSRIVDYLGLRLNLDLFPALHSLTLSVSSQVKHDIDAWVDNDMWTQDDSSDKIRDHEQYRDLTNQYANYFTRTSRIYPLVGPHRHYARWEDGATPSLFHETFNTTVNYERTHLIMVLHPSYLVGGVYPVGWTETRSNARVSWTAKFPDHQITNQKVVKEDGWPAGVVL